MNFKKLLFFVLIVTTLMGCSEKAKIKIFNNTGYNEIWYSLTEDEQVFIDSFQTVELAYDLNNYVLFSEEKKVTLCYGGKYVVTREEKIQLSPGETKNIEILTDAGEMVIQNGSFDRHINEVYIVEAGNDFEVNLLSAPIGPWEYRTFNLESGFWDLKIVDNSGNVTLEHNIFISLESSWTYTYSGN